MMTEFDRITVVRTFLLKSSNGLLFYQLVDILTYILIDLLGVYRERSEVCINA